MMNVFRLFSVACFVFLSISPMGANEEKTEVSPIVRDYAHDMTEIREKLQKSSELAAQMIREGVNDDQYVPILNEVKFLKKEKDALQERWRKCFADEASAGDESYVLWDMGETTVSQLVMEYGASDFLYVIPPELSSMKISLFSSIPLPRESWNEMVEMVLVHNGVGVKKINPWVKQLYILKLDPSAVESVVCREQDLALVDPQSRIFFILSPNAEQVKSVQGFFERFSDPRQTTIQSIASKVVLVSTRETIEKMLGLYHAIWEQSQGKIVRLINLIKIAPTEAEKVLKAVFGDGGVKTKTPSISGGEELFTLTLPQGLVLAGESQAVTRGEKIISDLERQLESPGEKVVSWYTCKHSNPEDIASVLSQVYDSLIGSSIEQKTDTTSEKSESSGAPNIPSQAPCPSPVFPCPNTVYNPVLPVNPAFIQPGVIQNQQKTVYGNFIVDTKTASILMIVRREELSKIKTLLKKLDVPKRMVQIDVLLVEKRLQDRRQVGIDLLNINNRLQVPSETGASFQTDQSKLNKGLLHFIFRRPAGSWPGIDLAYNFLLAQDDLRINANPTVLAINQTPAQISIVEEISINNGAIQLNTGTVTVEKSYTRAQYGTNIVLLPTIHLPDPDDDPQTSGFVTLHTDVTFDTTLLSIDDRPPVTRRHVTNDVQIADGETVILGGLRRKSEEDRREKIPFLGDLPGIGKLFGADHSTETNTEMFIFITPRIVHEPVEDLRRIRHDEYCLRAGDIPEFLERLDEAKEKERKSVFSNSMKMLFDRY